MVIVKCAYCGSIMHTYKRHYPPASDRLYESLREKWYDFLNNRWELPDPDISIEDADDLYDNLVDEFCEEHNYSAPLKEMAFMDIWWDTFKDDFFKKLERDSDE